MTIRVTALKSFASKTPLGKAHLGEDEPDLAAGDHPHPDDALLALEPGGRIAGRELADDRRDEEQAADEERRVIRRVERVEDPDIDRGPDRDEEDGHEEVAQLRDAVLDRGGLGRLREQEPGGERPDDDGRPRLLGQPGEPEGEDHGQDRGRSRQVDPAREPDQAGDDEAPHDQGPEQEPEGDAGDPGDPEGRGLLPRVIPATTVRMTSPMTSSMTAAPRMIWLSGSCKRPRSERTRAVMPTLVAVIEAPATMATRFGSPRRRQAANPRANGRATPTAATAAEAPPTLRSLREIGLEADGEEEDDDAQLREQMNRLDAGVDEAEDRGAEQDARHQLAEDGRLADGLGQGTAEPCRPEHDDEEAQELGDGQMVHVVQVASGG